MSKTYRPYDPDQQLLLPAAMREWLPDGHLAYFISDVVDQLELSEITARYERESRGGPPYHPRMMVKVLLYGYCVGVASSRRIAQRLHEDIAFRVLAANNTPDFRTISDFRKDNLDALSGLFLQVLALCQRAGLVKLGHVALDGTKVRANASAQGDERSDEREGSAVGGGGEELLRRAHEVDDEEDRRYGQSKRGDELPQELAFREGRLEKIREAMASEAEAQAAAEQAEAVGKGHSGVPDDKGTSPMLSRVSCRRRADGTSCRLTCQAVVDSAHQVIVAAHATNQTSDKQQAVTMVEKAIDNVGSVPREVSADAGYYSAQAVEVCTGCAWTRSSRRSGPATAEWCHPRPGVAYPVICLPGTGCAGSCRPNGAGNATLCGCKRWSRYSARSSRAEASASSCCGAWRRSAASGR